jgi:hypothetical protein
LYALHITIEDIAPSIWRRFAVPGNHSLQQLHLLIQFAFGWQNYHLYEFEVGPARYSLPDPDAARQDTLDSRQVTLDQLDLPQGSRFVYNYDFGDDWLHAISIEGVTPIPPGLRFPILLGGARACPPEDCGGPHGYERYLDALRQPRTPAGKEALAWRGAFDPEHWDPRPILRLFAPHAPPSIRGRRR